MNNINANDSNITLHSVTSENQIFETVFNIFIIIIQIDVMLSMGAIVTVQDILDQFKHPICILIALVSQFVLMPLSAFGLVNLAQFPSTIAIAAMILATCPGGSLSNLFTYFWDGDVPLSIVLTSISTVLALGFMPLNMWLYTRQWEGTDQLKIPYKSIAITLVWILVPFIFGMLAKRFTVKFANLLNKIGSISAMVILCFLIILEYFTHTEAFHKSWKLWLIAAAIPTAGFLFGYSFAFIAKQTPKQCRTIALETGMQSISLACTIVVTSFPTHLHSKMVPFISMAGIFFTVFLLIVAAIFQMVVAYNRRSSSKTSKSKTIKSKY